MDWVWVKTGARLHLGQLDLNGSLGRLYGGVGLAIDRPGVRLLVSRWDRLEVEIADHSGGVAEGGSGLSLAERVESLATPVLVRYRLPGALIRVREWIPAHIGLGSGTQLAMAVALGITRAYGINVPPAELARLTDREGSRSGIGVGVFCMGGLVVDGGKPLTGGTVPSGDVPPIICRLPFPSDWGIVLVIPRVRHDMHGPKEEQTFRRLSPMDETLSGALCRLVMMQLLPALVDHDLVAFGRAVTALQRKVGEYFAPVQGGVFYGPSGRIVEFLLSRGVAGAGQSSWGPVVYAFCEKERVARLVAETHDFTAGEAQVLEVRGVNHGARWGRIEFPPFSDSGSRGGCAESTGSGGGTLPGAMGSARVAWGITGAGHLLAACVELLLRVPDVEVFLSRAGEEVLRAYRLHDVVVSSGRRVFRDIAASAPPTTRLYRGMYSLVVIAPATSNSVAKFVCGISDNLISNLFAHAGKCRVPVVVLPSDVEEEVVSVTPSGGTALVRPRSVDLDNVGRLRGFAGVTVAESIEELRRELARRSLIG